ncbi:hypothetical protein RMSM_02429 [Rhodopirellula maiorica SM1]|uniref:Uncharacterized protein n=1 Tax=Rhodopirellula maiorica SM1 TaxID=1265738 RepID=M5RMU0_9BACT|nr:hypothetical protein RMSM_02429 [Rhodopirellula maiorica SM1]
MFGFVALGALVFLSEIDFDVAPITLGRPRCVARITLHLLQVRCHALHRDTPSLANLVFLHQRLQRLHTNVGAGSGIDNDLVAIADDIFVRIAPRGQQEPVAFVDLGALQGMRQRRVGQPAWFARCGGFVKLVHEPERQIPGELIRRAVTIGAFDLNRGKVGAGQKTVAVNIERGMAVLASHSFLVVNVLLHRQVVFGMQLGLVTAVFGVGRMERGFHQSLKRDADPFTTIVTGGASFHGNAAVRRAVHGDLGIAGALDRMHQCVPRFIVRYRLIVTFVKALVPVGDVARGTAHAAEIASFLSSFDCVMATLAFLTDIGERGK